MKVYFIRHGESEFNAKINEKFDSHLTLTGFNQAEEVSFRLKKLIDSSFVGFSSSYFRCCQTALTIHYITDLKFHVYHCFGESAEECHAGKCLTYHQNKYHFPEMTWEDVGYDFNESKESYKRRMETAVGLLKQNSVVVAHRKTIEDMIRLMTKTEEPMAIGNCSISLVEDNKYVGQLL